MTTKTTTISIDEAELDRYQAAARAEGISFSAFMARAARSDYMRRQAARYRQVMSSLGPDDAAFQGELAEAAAARMFAA